MKSPQLIRCLRGALPALVVASVFLGPAAADAAISAHTDVMFLVDTTGSMEKALDEAGAEIRGAIKQIDAGVPDVQYGVSEVRDYGGSRYAENEFDVVPWRLDQSITANRNAVAEAIARLEAHGGGDVPEAYGRALWETRNNPSVGWRPGVQRLIVLLADSVPHDPELDEGIPEGVWIKASPWTTGEELLEPAGVSGTALGAGTVLDWQSVLQQLAVGITPLEVVEYRASVLPYWENWAARTKGKAIPAIPGQFDHQVADLVVAGTRVPCPTVRGRTGKMLLAALKCKEALAALRGQCRRRLSRGKGKFRPPVQLVKHLRGAKFRGLAPAGFQSLGAVLARFQRVRTAIDLLKSLPHLVKALPRPNFERVALDMAAVPGARACAAGLILAVK
jgi:hypothetical protein